MKSSSLSAFFLAVLIYSLLVWMGYSLWTSNLVNTAPEIKLNKVPVSLSMFSAPPEKKTIEVKQETVVQPEPAVEQETTTEPEPVIRPKTENTPKPVVDPIKKPLPKPIEKPKPIKTEVKKEIIKEAVKAPTPKSKPILEEPKQKDAAPKKIEKSAPPQETTTVKQKPPAPQFTSQQIANAEQEYLNALRQQIMAYAQDTYPRRAKRRRWEGDVIIEFTLTKSGRITQLSIVESSGRSLLDQAALEIFQAKMAYQFKAFPKEITRNNWSIKVPVSYNLR